ncbi:hypothetical protein Tco_1486097 [Tanacetum coccineum]
MVAKPPSPLLRGLATKLATTLPGHATCQNHVSRHFRELTYEKCNDIPQESRALIDTFLKEGSDKDYELNLSMYGKAAKIEKQMNAKLVWLLEKYNYRSQTHIGGSSSQTHEICDLYLTDKELHQLHLDEEVLRETLEEEAKDEKEREENIRQKQADDDEFFLEFGVVKSDSEYGSD